MMERGGVKNKKMKVKKEKKGFLQLSQTGQFVKYCGGEGGDVVDD